MSNPFAVQPGGVIQGQGVGGSIASGIAGVLAQMQTTKENQFRMQELANAQAQQQALQAYYEAQARAQQQELAMKAGEQAIVREGQAQVGAAQRAALLGIQQPDTQGIFSQVLQDGAQLARPGLSLPSLFTGVSNQNLPAAIQGVQEVQKLTPKPEDFGADPKKMEYWQHLQRTDPAAAKVFYENFIKKQPPVQVNVGQKAETAYAVEGAKADIAVRTEVEKAARQAIQSMPSISEAYKVLSRGQAFTGLGAKQKLFAARVAAAVGVPDADLRAADSQTLWRLTGETTLSYLRSRDLGSGTAVSNSDRDYMAALAGQDLTQQPLALRKTMRINFGSLIYKQFEAINELKNQAIAHPESATQNLTRAAAIQRQYEVGWKEYAKMLAEEGVAESDILQRLIFGGVSEPEKIIRGLPKARELDINETKKSLFPTRPR